MSAPSEYVEEAGIYGRRLLENGSQPARTLVEFGSGGGNNASYLKRHFEITLVDVSEGMLSVSRKLNPECSHFLGDMRTVRLGREFDRVFVHDAICYMTTAEDLRRAVETAFVHCRPGGAALFAPDFVRETFRGGSDHGGSDGEDRGFRYLEWVRDPDSSGTTYVVDYAYMLREGESVRVEHERHIEGLFPREEWLAILRNVGFEPYNLPFEHSELDPGQSELFLGLKPEA